MKCYDETLERSEGRCPDGCSTCLLEGQIALALKSEGLSDQDIARKTVAVIMGEEPPPAGVSFENQGGHGGHGHGGQAHEHGGHGGHGSGGHQ
jgi:hypothetical protein